MVGWTGQKTKMVSVGGSPPKRQPDAAALRSKLGEVVNWQRVLCSLCLSWSSLAKGLTSSSTPGNIMMELKRDIGLATVILFLILNQKVVFPPPYSLPSPSLPVLISAGKK